MVSFWRHLSPLFPLFWVNQKGVFWIFLKIGNLYGFEHENHSEQVHNMWPYELTWKEQLFLTFWKKYGFSRLWLNINFQKNENFQKWEKMVSDGIFDFPIANLVSFDHLFVKID